MANPYTLGAIGALGLLGVIVLAGAVGAVAAIQDVQIDDFRIPIGLVMTMMLPFSLLHMVGYFKIAQEHGSPGIPYLLVASFLFNTVGIVYYFLQGEALFESIPYLLGTLCINLLFGILLLRIAAKEVKPFLKPLGIIYLIAAFLLTGLLGVVAVILEARMFLKLAKRNPKATVGRLADHF